MGDYIYIYSSLIFWVVLLDLRCATALGSSVLPAAGYRPSSNIRLTPVRRRACTILPKGELVSLYISYASLAQDRTLWCTLQLQESVTIYPRTLEFPAYITTTLLQTTLRGLWVKRHPYTYTLVGTVNL